jgi:hypothetical protein
MLWEDGNHSWLLLNFPDQYGDRNFISILMFADDQVVTAEDKNTM